TGRMGGRPHFDADPSRTYLNFDDGLNRVSLGDGARTLLLRVTGAGWYFAEGRAPVDDLQLSPDGRWALAQTAQQLHLLAMPDGEGRTIDLADPGVAHRRLTSVGADFFGWSDGGRTLHWAIGSTWYRRPLDGVRTQPAQAPSPEADEPRAGVDGVERFPAVC